MNEEINKIDTRLNYDSEKMVCAELLSREIMPYVAAGEEVAKNRKETFISNYFESVTEKGIDPDVVKQSFADPSMQSDFISAANGYIKCGDKDLLTILSEILAHRINTKERSLLQVTLGEAIKVCPLLLNRQMATLALVFRLTHCRRIGITDLESYISIFKNDIIGLFESGVSKEQSDFQHLNYTRCATPSAFSNDLLRIIMESNRIIFCKGKTKEEIGFEGDKSLVDLYPFFFGKSWADQNRYVCNFDFDNQLLSSILIPMVDPQILERIKATNDGDLINENTVRSKMIEQIPIWESFEKYWKESGIANLTLTSVGIVVGAIYSSKFLNQNLDLSIWIK